MAAPFPDLYGSRRWRKRTRLQKQHHPLCERCEREGRTTEAMLSHHVVPHNGDKVAFYYGKLESLCLSCHLVEHGRAPMRGYVTDIGPDGFPLDPRHPFYQSDATRRKK